MLHFDWSDVLGAIGVFMLMHPAKTLSFILGAVLACLGIVHKIILIRKELKK